MTTRLCGSTEKGLGLGHPQGTPVTATSLVCGLRCPMEMVPHGAVQRAEQVVSCTEFDEWEEVLTLMICIHFGLQVEKNQAEFKKPAEFLSGHMTEL